MKARTVRALAVRRATAMSGPVKGRAVRGAAMKGRGAHARVAAAGIVLLGGAAGCSWASNGQDAADNAPTAGKQLEWLVSASRHLPISDADAKAHVSSAALTSFGGAAGLSKSLARIGPLSAQRPPKSVRTRAVGWFDGANGHAVFGAAGTDRAGMISGLFFTRQPASWKELDSGLRRLAPNVSFASAEIDAKGRCRVVHGVNENTPRPLGSAFKVYVLGALSDAVAKHQVGWDTPLAVNDAWKSLPSGTFQDKRAGTQLTLAQYADAMISNSDNTAADHLIHRLGRDAVEGELSALGNRHEQRNRPFLTTREVFALKGTGYPAGAQRYLKLPAGQRGTALTGLDAAPLTGVAPWRQPRDIDRIEWFASPTDMCAAFKGLSDRAAAPGQANVGHALSINDGGIQLDPKTYPTVWFKGGSEPGVMSANFLAKASNGRTVVSSVMLSDSKRSFPNTTELGMLALARAGIQLAAS